MDDQQNTGNRDVLDYIGDLASELARMAKAINCRSLAQILQMAKYEAEMLAQPTKASSKSRH